MTGYRLLVITTYRGNLDVREIWFESSKAAADFANLIREVAGPPAEVIIRTVPLWEKPAEEVPK